MYNTYFYILDYLYVIVGAGIILVVGIGMVIVAHFLGYDANNTIRMVLDHVRNFIVSLKYFLICNIN